MADWLVVIEYVIDNTPGSHGYTPRDLERSWSLSLVFEKDVLRDALQFEPVSDWACGQFKQFKELSDAVKIHWEKASASRARIANRHRRTVDLKVGDRVVWNSPTPRPEGPGLTDPWRVAEVHGHRLFLEPACPRDRGGAEAKPIRMEAHAEDCVLVPPDAEAGLESQGPIVFAEDPLDQAPSRGQQVSGEANQVEFVVQA